MQRGLQQRKQLTTPRTLSPVKGANLTRPGLNDVKTNSAFDIGLDALVQERQIAISTIRLLVLITTKKSCRVKYTYKSVL